MKLVRIISNKDMHGSEKEAFINPEHITTVEKDGGTTKARVAFVNGQVFVTTDTIEEFMAKVK